MIETGPGYKLGFVELDDQGWFWDRRQWAAVREMVCTEAKLDADRKTDGVVLVVVVHGWKNNADYKNDNVRMFRRTLADLNDAEREVSRIEKRLPRKVVGLYVGWRGLSATVEPFKELSFYERKNTAERIGHRATTELFTRLEELQTSLNRTIRRGSTKSDLVIVGHSFGGAVVYSALSQIMTERFVQTIGEHDTVLRPFGDLVVLLNPAFEAARYANLHSLATNEMIFPLGQGPVVAILTSQTDVATKRFFPLGRFFSTLFEKHRPELHQAEANRTAVGHYLPFTTHELVYDAKLLPNPLTAVVGQNRGDSGHRLPTLEHSMRNVLRQRDVWHANAKRNTTPKPSVSFPFDECTLTPNSQYQQGNPFLVVSVQKQIMDGHNDITNRVLINFLIEFIYFSRPQTRSAQ